MPTIDEMKAAWLKLRPKVFNVWEATAAHEDGTPGLPAGIQCDWCGRAWWDVADGTVFEHKPGCPVAVFEGQATAGTCVRCGECEPTVCEPCSAKEVGDAVEQERARARAAIADVIASVD